MPKASNYFQSDRPESGGADKDMQREKSGLLDLDKATLAEDIAEKREGGPASKDDVSTAPFSIGSERNPDPHNK